MALHPFGVEQVERRALQLVGSGEAATLRLILRRQVDQLVGHRDPLRHEQGRARIRTVGGGVLDRLAHIDDFADAPAALHRDRDGQVPDIVGEIFEQSHRSDLHCLEQPLVGRGMRHGLRTSDADAPLVHDAGGGGVNLRLVGFEVHILQF